MYNTTHYSQDNNGYKLDDQSRQENMAEHIGRGVNWTISRHGETQLSIQEEEYKLDNQSRQEDTAEQTGQTSGRENEWFWKTCGGNRP